MHIFYMHKIAKKYEFIKKRDGKLVNVDIGQVDMVKDPWEDRQPGKNKLVRVSRKACPALDAGRVPKKSHKSTSGGEQQ